VPAPGVHPSPADGDTPPLENGDWEALERAAHRGRQADRDLAKALEQAEPAGPGPSARHLAGLGRRPRPAPDVERRLVRAAERGDQAARARLVEAHIPLIAAEARRFRATPAVDDLELVQEGVAGLLRALEHYDPHRGTPFWAYARWWVRHAMRRVIRELDDSAALSDRALRDLSRFKHVGAELAQELGREPAVEELVERSGLSQDEVERLLEATRPPKSLNDPLLGQDGGIVGSFDSRVADPSAEEAYERALDKVEAEHLLPLLSTLSDREREILRLRAGVDGEPLSRAQIAECLGVSPSRVRDIERRARAKLTATARAVGATG
jgi:RNA polymerase sigma factor (sigma-70 family)